MIHVSKRQGKGVSRIARQTRLDRKTLRRYPARVFEAPEYKPHAPRARITEPYEAYLQERLSWFPDLTARWLTQEIRERGYEGGYKAAKTIARQIRPPKQTQFERRFDTPPRRQAQVDFAEFAVEFADDPGFVRKVL